MISIFEDFASSTQKFKNHIVRNKDHYLLGGGTLAGVGSAYYLMNPKFHQGHHNESLPNSTGMMRLPSSPKNMEGIHGNPSNITNNAGVGPIPETTHNYLDTAKLKANIDFTN